MTSPVQFHQYSQLQNYCQQQMENSAFYNSQCSFGQCYAPAFDFDEEAHQLALAAQSAKPVEQGLTKSWEVTRPSPRLNEENAKPAIIVSRANASTADVESKSK